MEVSTTFRGMLPSEPLLAAVRRHCEALAGCRLCEAVIIDEGATCTITVHVETEDGQVGTVETDPDAFLALGNAFAKILATLKRRNPQAYSEAAQ